MDGDPVDSDVADEVDPSVAMAAGARDQGEGAAAAGSAVTHRC